MSADLLLAVLVIDEIQAPDFAAAHRAVEAIESVDILQPDFFDEVNPDERGGGCPPSVTAFIWACASCRPR